MAIQKEIEIYDHKLELVSVYNQEDLTSGLLIGDVSVDYDVFKYGRCLSNPEHEEIIDQVWTKKISTNSRLYNASKFRLHDMTIADSSSLRLSVGLTDYKDQLGTHYSGQAEEMILQGTQDSNGADPSMYMSNGIGVGAITLTRDDYLVLVQRAGWVGESANKVDRPGGHPEPDLVLKPDTDPAGTISHLSPICREAYSKLDPSLVLKEIFASPQNELRDEVNIALSEQSEPQLLGRIRALHYGGRVGLDFLVSLKLDKSQVETRYRLGTQTEVDESVKLIFIPLSQVQNWALDPALVCRMTEHCLGGLRLLYHLWQRRTPLI